MLRCPIFIFQSPLEPKSYSFFDIGKRHDYFKSSSLHEGSEALISITGISKASCYFSGPFMELLKQQPEVLASLKAQVEKGDLEILGGTFYHSLSSLINADLFAEEVKQHQKLTKECFGVQPKGFINTAALYSNDLAKRIISLGFEFAIVPRVEWFQGSLPEERIFQATEKDLLLLLIGTETGEHHEFSVRYVTTSDELMVPTQTASTCIKEKKAATDYSLPDLVALDDAGRDLQQYVGNSLQKQLLKSLRELSLLVKAKKKKELKTALLQLASSQQFLKIGQQSEPDLRYHHYNWLINCIADLELRAQS